MRYFLKHVEIYAKENNMTIQEAYCNYNCRICYRRPPQWELRNVLEACIYHHIVEKNDNLIPKILKKYFKTQNIEDLQAIKRDIFKPQGVQKFRNYLVEFYYLYMG